MLPTLLLWGAVLTKATAVKLLPILLPTPLPTLILWGVALTELVPGGRGFFRRDSGKVE